MSSPCTLRKQNRTKIRPVLCFRFKRWTRDCEADNVGNAAICNQRMCDGVNSQLVVRLTFRILVKHWDIVVNNGLVSLVTTVSLVQSVVHNSVVSLMSAHADAMVTSPGICLFDLNDPRHMLFCFVKYFKPKCYTKSSCVDINQFMQPL